MVTDRARLDALASYLPRIALRDLVSRPAYARADSLSAALMLVDVTGFTRLTSALVDRGAVGTEELFRAINGYFGRIIDIVDGAGGDIVKIVGDAVMAVWPAEDSLEVATARAVACGLAITAALNDFEVSRDVRLSLKVGICSGGVTAAHVGGLDGRWLFVLAGDALRQLSGIEPQLQTGAVITSAAAWTLVRERSVGHEIDGGAMRIDLAQPADVGWTLTPSPLEPQDEIRVRAYVPAVGLARLEAGHSEWSAEIRRTTAVFADIRGLEGPSVDLAARLQSIAHFAQRLGYRYQGWLKEITADDKGTTLVMVFGVPPFTHEDDPGRSLNCASEFVAGLQALGFTVGTGIATGSAFCGPVGSPKRKDYAVLGPHMIRASRLAKAAGNGAVLCDAATQEAVGEQIPLERLPGYVLKGVSGPVEVYRVAPRRGGRGGASGFVDRERELAEGDELIREVLAGRGGLEVLEGEPGIGKSRVIDAWVRAARARGIRCVIGAAEEIDSASPYHAWRGVFEQLLGLREGDSAATRTAALAQLRESPDTERFIPLLDQLLSLDLPENDATRQLGADARADNTRSLLVRILSREAERGPLMIVLEDVHWLDSASWALADRASAEIPSLLFVLSTRPTSRSGDVAQRIRSGKRVVIRLAPLARKDAESLASNVMGVTELDAPVADVLHSRSEGNPLYIEQVAYAMRDERRVVVKGGVAQAAQGTPHVGSSIIPEYIARLITSRIGQLPEGESLTTKVASVIGRPFSLVTLAAIYPMDIEANTLREHLETLVQMDILTVDTVSKEPTYMFRHVATQEVLYTIWPPSQVAPIHRRIAEWYEAAFAHAITPYHAFLAHHWSKAGDASRAIDQFEVAGTRALRTFANEEAIHNFEQAIALERSHGLALDPRRRARWHLQLGEAYVHMSRYADGRPHLEAGLRLFGRSAPGGTLQRIGWLLAELGKQGLRRLGVLRHVHETVGEERDDFIAVLRAYERLAEVSFYSRDKLVPLYCVIRILNSAEASGIPDEIARGLAGTGALFGVIPFPKAAEWYLDHARSVLERARDAATQEIVRIVIAFYYIGTASWNRARVQLDHVRETAQNTGDRRRYDDALSNLLMLECLKGSFAAGVTVADELRSSANRRNDLRFVAEAAAGHAYCMLQLGRTGEAMVALESARAVASELPVDVRITLAGTLALTHLERGERQHALAAADEAMRLTEGEQPAYYGAFTGYVGPAEIHLALAEAGLGTPELQTRAKESLTRLRRYAAVFPVGRPRAALLTGRSQWLRGERRRAFGSWGNAIAEAERLDMPFEKGLAHREIGRHLAAADPERIRHLDEAREVFRALDAVRALAATEVSAASSVIG